MSELNTIRIAAAVIMDEKGRLLLVRKRGTAFFMQPAERLSQEKTLSQHSFVSSGKS